MTPTRMAQVSIALCVAAWVITAGAMLHAASGGRDDVTGPLTAGSFLLIWLFDIGAAVGSFMLTRKAIVQAPTDTFVDAAYLVARVTAGAVILLSLVMFGI